MKRTMKKITAMIIVAGMLLTAMPYADYQNVNAKTTTPKCPANKGSETKTTTTKCPANKGSKAKTTTPKCPANKGSKTNKIYLYKSGTKSSKKTKTIRVYQTKQLYFKGMGKAKKIKWKSSKKKVAKVSKQGILTGLKTGKTTVTAKVKKTKYQIKIKVKKPLKIKGESVGGSQLKQGIFINDYYASDKNTLISPTSINIALGMVLNGAKGNVFCPSNVERNQQVYVTPKSEVEKYLGNKVDKYNEYAKKIMDAKDNSTLKIANSIWYKSGIKLSDTFENAVKKYYYATTNEIPFDNTGAEQINKWVNDNTDGMIDKIIDNIDKSAYAYILNATLFNGKWTWKFDTSDVKSKKFKKFNGKKVNVEMMEEESNSYYENDYALAFEKTYEKDKKYSFIGILPKAKGSFKLENLNIEELLKKKKKDQVQIGIPKFEYAWKNNIKSSLVSAGVKEIFNKYIPALNPMFDDTDSSNKYVDEIIHSTAIEMNTDGTKAAAVTAAVVKETSIRMCSNKILLDRPFAYIIKNNKTGEILFIGKVVDPTLK